MEKGKVKFYNEEKGFGFITDHATGQDFFTHISGLKSEVKEGDEVEYEIIEGKKGLMASNVSLISE